MTAPATDRTVGLVTAGSIDRLGGGGMRLRALEQAVDGCRRYELACDRWDWCGYACTATGEDHPLGHRPGWFYGRAFCPAYAPTLLDRLIADGIRTVICSGLDAHQYVEVFAADPRLHVVFDMHNVEHPLHRAIEAAVPRGSAFARRFPNLHLRRIAHAERTAILAADEVWVCSEDDRRLLLATYPDAADQPIRVVPNVVPLPAEAPRMDRVPVRATYTGRFDWYPNAVAADLLVDHIAPRLLAQGCSLPVVLAGARVTWPPRQVLPPNVRLVPDPDDIDVLIRDALMLVPLTLGGGSRLKVLEAFALGTPVISTAKGVEGLAVEPEVHYVPAETPAEFADRTVELSHDAGRRRRLATAGWDLVRDTYSIDRLRNDLRAAGVPGG